MDKVMHGFSKHPLYKVLTHIKQRCLNPKYHHYINYGGRGIKVCAEWLDKESGVENFCKWGLDTGYKKGLQIDRIDNDGDYAPDNCRWVSSKKNNRNRRDNVLVSIGGKTKCVFEWCEELGINVGTVYQRKKPRMGFD